MEQVYRPFGEPIDRHAVLFHRHIDAYLDNVELWFPEPQKELIYFTGTEEAAERDIPLATMQVVRANFELFSTPCVAAFSTTVGMWNDVMAPAIDGMCRTFGMCVTCLLTVFARHYASTLFSDRHQLVLVEHDDQMRISYHQCAGRCPDEAQARIYLRGVAPGYKGIHGDYQHRLIKKPLVP